MSGQAKWIPVAILVTTTVVSALPWAEHRWLNAAVTAGVVGAAIVFAWTWADARPKLWVAVCCVAAAAAVASFALHVGKKSECTAVNASGERVVIGTEFTELGAKYKALYPTEDADQMLAALGGYQPDVIWTSSSMERCSFVLAVTGALWMPLFGIAAVAGAKALSASGIGQSETAAPPKQQVFLSYSHADAEAARRLRNHLTEQGIAVIMDTDSMTPGETIAGFIERSIRDSDVVVSLVSNRSLTSAWVAMETIHTLNRNKWVKGRLFAACYLDDDFLRPEFRLQCTEKIDARLKEIEEIIPEYAKKRIDTVDLDEEKTRLYELRNHLGTILATLKGSLSLDVREGRLEESVQRLAAAIRELRGSAVRARAAR